MDARILVVEDEWTLAEGLRDTLEYLGYVVPAVAASGAEALAAAERERPDLALMDIHLRGSMDGIEAAAILRRRFNVPVVYLTGHSDDVTLRRAKETEPYGYLVKPFNEQELHSAVEIATHKHALESRLAERERWFSTTLASIGDAVIAVDRDDRVTFLNPVAEALTGVSRGEAVGAPAGDVLRVVGADGARADAPSRAALETGARAELPRDATLLTRAGQSVAVDGSAAPIVDQHGRVSGAVVVVRDVTEKRQLEARLALTDRLASLGTMAAGVGHEINNPLTYVLGNLEFALEALRRRARGALAPELERDLREVDEVLAEARQGALRVRDIVQALKRFSRAEDATRARVELRDVVDDAARLTASELRPRGRLRVEHGDAPAVVANASLLHQVFVNLLINAAQALDERAAGRNEVVVRTRADERGRAVAEVCDTGHGIAPADLPRIFEPFFTTRPVGKGTGLGLAICHRIVSALGGEIAVESEVGRGTTLRVTLPAAPPDAPAAEAARASSIPPSRRARVLVVDDEEPVARSIERVLRAAHDVAVETDPRAALARVAGGEDFDVIFCDLMMPTLSGMHLFEALSAARPELARRVVFITGGALSPRASDFLARQPNLCIAKPLSAQSLRRVAAGFAA